MANILIVEDDPNAAEFVREFLQDEGFVCESTAVHERVFELVGQKWPDLILMDSILVGYPLQGWEIAQRIKADPATTGIPIIGLSGKDGAGGDPLRMASDTFLAKPYDPFVLLETIQKFLGAS
ncbi:MAG: response regulator [Pirellulales bacterium]